MLVDIDNGKVDVKDNCATYTCNTGFTLMGNATRKCAGGNWRGPKPQCGELYCKEEDNQVELEWSWL